MTKKTFIAISLFALLASAFVLSPYTYAPYLWIDASYVATNDTTKTVNDTVLKLALDRTTAHRDGNAFQNVLIKNNAFVFTDNYINLGSAHNSFFDGNFTIYIAVKPGDGHPAATQCFFGANDGANYVQFQLQTTGQVTWNYKSNGNSVNARSKYAVFPDGAASQWAVFSVQVNDTCGILKMNGVELEYDSALSFCNSSLNPVNYNNTKDLYVGARYNGAEKDNFTGSIGEVIFIPSLSGETPVTQYLSTKYAIPTIHYTVMAGQSNAYGQAIDDSLRTNDTIYSAYTYYKTAESYADNGSWQQLDTSNNRNPWGNNPNRHGPEMQYMQLMQDQLAEAVYLIKYGEGGIQLDSSGTEQTWYPYENQEMYFRLIEWFVKPGINKNLHRGIPVIDAVLWIHGTSDADEEAKSKRYTSNLRKLKTQLVTDLSYIQGDTNITFVIQELASLTGRQDFIYWANIQKCQDTIAANDNRAWLATKIENNLLKADSVHFNYLGVDTAARRYNAIVY